MVKTPKPLLVVAVLVSFLVHIFLVDWAVDMTIKWHLFSTASGDQLFRIRDLEVRHTPQIPLGKPELLPDKLISLLGPTKEETVVEAENNDKNLLAEAEKFIGPDVPVETLLETIERAMEAEPIAKVDESPASPAVEGIVAQEIFAVDEEMIKEAIPPSRPRISANVKRGTATQDIIGLFTETDSSTEPLPEKVATKPTVEPTASGALTEKEDMVRLAMAEQTKTIPGVIAPPPPVIIEKEIESADLVDIVTEEYERIRKYPPLDDLLTVRLFTHHRPGETRGYFELLVEPRKDKKDFRLIPKDIIFLVDSSKSITQRKLNSYVEGLKSCLRALAPQDRFNIVEFKSSTRKLSPQDVVPATPQMIAKGEAFLSGLVSEGATDVYQALTQLVKLEPAPGRPRVIFLVSDGRPQAQIWQDREIINQVTRLNNLKASIFTFAGGQKINTYLLDLISYRNRGARMFEVKDEKIAESLFTFYREFSSPILMTPRFNFGSFKSTEVYPKVLPDLYLHSRLEIFGRYESEAEFSMQLLGVADRQTKEYILQQKLTGKDNGDERVAQRWAFRKIYYLVGQIVQKGQSQAILSEIQKLSAGYNVGTSYYRRGGGRS